MKHYKVITLVLVLLLPLSLSATDPKFINYVDKVKNACYRVETKAGKFLGSGFFINKHGDFLTCDHVIHNEETNVRLDTVKVSGYSDINLNIKGDTVFITQLITFFATVKHYEPKFDIAILQVDKVGSLVQYENSPITIHNFSSRVFGKSKNLKEGMDVGLCAFIKDTYKTPKPFISKGIISTIRNVFNRNLDNTIEVIQCDISISTGTSGGAIFSADNGYIIGFQRSGYFGKDKSIATPYSIAFTIEQITPIFDSLNIEYMLK